MVYNTTYIPIYSIYIYVWYIIPHIYLYIVYICMVCNTTHIYLHTYSSWRRLASEVITRVLLLARSAAALWAMLRLSHLVLRSFSTACRHVSHGCPLFLLPWGAHLRAALVMELEGVRQTQLSPLCLYYFYQSVHSCSISQFFAGDGVGPVYLEDVLEAFGLEQLHVGGRSTHCV